MKKLLALLLVFLMLISTLAGCNKGGDVSSEPENPSSDVSSDDDVTSDDPSLEEPVSSDEETIEDPYYEEDEDDGFYYEEDEDDEDDIKDVPLSPEEERLQAMLAGEDAEFNKDSLYREGHLYRLAQAIKKSKSGKEVTLVFYGSGANTASVLPDITTNSTKYSNFVQEWWVSNIGPCKIVKAGTDNLTSTNACMRVEHDVLRYKPDVVFLDFSVQDGIGALAKTNAQGYDNLVRRILHSETKPAVVSLMLTGAEQIAYSMNPQNAPAFNTASSEHKKIAEYYNLPVVDFEYAFNENSVELVKVTTKKEEPLLYWSTIALKGNVIMNEDGHTMLAGTIKYLLQTVMNKLNKVPTKDYDYPTFNDKYGDKYINGSFISIGDIIDGKATGYSTNLSTIDLEEYEYSYAHEDLENPLTPYIKTWHHYKYEEGHAEKWKANEINPEYITITLPEAVKQDTYVMFVTTDSAQASSKEPTSSAINVVCNDADGNQLSVVKPSIGNYDETVSLGRTSAVLLAKGTKEITIKIYVGKGSAFVLGLGSFAK